MNAEETWDKPFDVSMLGYGARVIISCPSEDLERECATILGEHGVTYASGNNLLYRRTWDEYGEDFCYFVENDTAMRGPKSDVHIGWSYTTYDKCTFYGDIDVDISEESFTTILVGD